MPLQWLSLLFLVFAIKCMSRALTTQRDLRAEFSSVKIADSVSLVWGMILNR